MSVSVKMKMKKRSYRHDINRLRPIYTKYIGMDTNTLNIKFV